MSVHSQLLAKSTQNSSKAETNTAFKLVGIGECMVELSGAGDGLLSKSFAGDVFNTLWYARKALGENWTVDFYSAVGTDPLSEQILAFIESGNINTAMVRRIPDRRPGLYMIHLDGAERSFSYWRDSSAARQLAADSSSLSAAIDAASVIYFSGISLAILPPEDVDLFLAYLATARAEGKIVVFDPNIRPSLWDDPARMRKVVAQAASETTIVLPSFDDEAAAFEDPNPEATVSRYQSYGSELVVLKNGAGDVLVGVDGSSSTTYPTQPVAKPVDTTGAGDSFNGAFLAEYLMTNDINSSIIAGQACAAEVVCHRGALIAPPSN